MKLVIDGVDLGTPEKAIAWIETGNFESVKKRYEVYKKLDDFTPIQLRKTILAAYEARILKGE